jgi:cell wall-associated NlpC family hydrolase
MLNYLKSLLKFRKINHFNREYNKFIELSDEQIRVMRFTSIALIGAKYKFGKEIVDLAMPVESITEIDCSELIEYVYNKAGIIVKDGSWHQYESSDEFLGKINFGDLLFMRKNSTGRICHVGLYIGSNMVIEASGIKKKVVPNTIDGFRTRSTKQTFAGIRRLLKDKIKYI